MKKAITTEEVLNILRSSDDGILSTREVTEIAQASRDQDDTDDDTPCQRSVNRRLNDLHDDGLISKKGYGVISIWWANDRVTPPQEEQEPPIA